VRLWKETKRDLIGSFYIIMYGNWEPEIWGITNEVIHENA